MRRLGGGLLVAALALASPLRVRAQDEPAPQPAPLGEAKALANRGFELFQQGDYEESIGLFVQAEQLSHSPVILSYIAQAYEALGKLLEAQETYNRIVAEELAADAAEDFVKAQQRARRQLPQLERRIPHLRLRISGIDGTHAQVELDGKPVPSAQLGEPIPVNPGHRTVVLRAPALPAVVRGFTASERQISEIDIVVARGPAAPQVEEHTGIGLAPAVVAFSVGFAGLTLGAVTGALHLDRAAALEDRCPDNRCPPEYEPERDTISTLGVVSLVGFGIAAFGTGVGVVCIIVDATADDDTTTAAKAAFRIGPAGASIDVRF
jgi:tetratricopeptide (TPR) repeat protein